MKQKLLAFTLILATLIVAMLVVIAPTFNSKGFGRASVQQELDLPLILKDDKELKLIFFGYSGCVDFCTPRLQDLATFYNSLDISLQKRVGIEFLDISRPNDEELPHSFASSFHPHFRGVYLGSKNLRKYTREFNVYFAQSIFDSKEFNHTTSLYLVKKSEDKKVLRYIYTIYPFDFKLIQKDIKELLNE